MSDLVEKVTSALMEAEGNIVNEAKAAIAVVLNDAWSRINALGGTNPLNDEAVHWEGRGIEKSLDQIEQIARENGVSLNEHQEQPSDDPAKS